MANNFEVRIHAVDRFTKTFRNLNEQASKAARPLINIHRQVGSLAKEMHLDKAAKGLGRMSDAASTLTRTLGLSLGPLETVLAASAGGGVAGGLVAAGAAAVGLGVRFASTGFEISRTSQAIGVSTQDLQLWRAAAKMTGVDADVMTETLTGLGRSLQGMRWGRGPSEFRQAMNILGMSEVPLKNGIVDQVAVLENISRAMAKIDDPHTRESLANALHIPPEAIPLLVQGAEAIERFKTKAKELGVDIGPQDLKWSNDFTLSLNVLKLAVDGASNSLGSKLIPSLAAGVDYMTKMVAASKDSSLTTGLKSAADFATAGPRLLAWAGSALWHGNVPTTPAQRSVTGRVGEPISALTPSDTSGLGIKRNNPGNLRSWGNAPIVGGFAQFATPAEGLAAMSQQLGLYGQRGINSLNSIINRYAPANENNTGAYVADVARRTGFAPDQKLDLTDADTRASLMSAMVNHEQGSQPFTPEQYAAAVGKQVIHVQISGMPAGMTASVRRSSENAFVPTRIAYSFPGDGP